MRRTLIRFVLMTLGAACGTGGSSFKEAAPAEPTASAPPSGAAAAPDAAPRDEEDAKDADEGGSPSKTAPAAGAPPSPAMRRNAASTIRVAAVQARDVDEGALRAALERELEDLAACHEKELMRAPSLEGSASVDLSFDAGGVVGVRVSGLGDATLERCVEGVLGGMKVERADPGRGSAKVRLTFSRG